MIHTHTYDALVVGGGGAGLMAGIYLSREPGIRTAVVCKLYPTRSHTGRGAGRHRRGAGNLEEDIREWHAYDTIKGGDFLVDQDAVEILCREAVESIYELEHMGLPVRPHARRPDLPAPLRRAHHQLRRGAGAPLAATRPTAPAT